MLHRMQHSTHPLLSGLRIIPIIDNTAYSAHYPDFPAITMIFGAQ